MSQSNSTNEVLLNVLRCLPFTLYRQIMGDLGLRPSSYLGTIIDPIKPSTITVGGYLTNVALHEKNDIDKFEARAPIMLIGSNYGEHFAAEYQPPVVKEKTSKRGRKPKPKEPKKRIQGSGKYFNSQITFQIQSAAAKKCYKFKVFRNGQFQVPGVLTKDQSDISKPIKALTSYLSEVFDKTVGVRDQVVQMRNCKTSLNDLELSINTQALGKIIDEEKKTNRKLGIYKVEYHSSQNSSKASIKFLRPTKDKPFKQATLKILKQKINFEGFVGFDSVDEVYWWLNDLILDNYDEVIHDPNRKVDECVSSDTDDDEGVVELVSDSDDAVIETKPKSYAFNPYEYD